jgi:hypothetical protein
LLPAYFDPNEWQSALLYAYFALNYYDEQLFNVILNKANKFKNFIELKAILSNQRSFRMLTESEKSLNRIRLNQLAFEAALDKDYVDIAFHFI